MHNTIFSSSKLAAISTAIILGAFVSVGFSGETAFAANNGNNGSSNANGNSNAGGNGNGGGNGNSGGNGNGGANGNSSVSANSSAIVSALSPTHGNPNAPKSQNGKLASSLGALNAAHASAAAFAHASPNSRIGKIKAYYIANAAAQIADAQVASDLLAIQTYNDAVNQLATDQLNLPVGDPILATDQAAIDAALDAYTAATAALQTDQATAAAADAATQDALNAAANKQPVSAETKAALDALLVGKI